MCTLAQVKSLVGHPREYTPAKVVSIDRYRAGTRGQVDHFSFEERLSFKGLYFTKSRFDGVDHKTFCAHKGMLPTRAFLTLFRLSNII